MIRSIVLSLIICQKGDNTLFLKYNKTKQKLYGFALLEVTLTWLFYQVQVSNTGTMYTIPANQQQYIRANQLQQGLVLNQSGMSPNNQQVAAEEATRKREMRLMKNRYVDYCSSCVPVCVMTIAKP